MKKVLLTLAAVACAASVFAQGTVIFNNRVAGTIVTHVYLGGDTQLVGNGPTDFPAGTFDWTGFVPLQGAGYSAQLLAANGAGALESALVAAPVVTTFRTGTAAGQVATATATLTGVPENSPAATVMMVAWDNKGGLYPTWTEARVAWEAGLIAAGKSGPFTVEAIGGTQPAPYLLNLKSFNIYLIPEPSTFALAGLGAAALMIFRRRK